MHGPFTYHHILAIDLGKFNSVACNYDPVATRNAASDGPP